MRDAFSTTTTTVLVLTVSARTTTLSTITTTTLLTIATATIINLTTCMTKTAALSSWSITPMQTAGLRWSSSRTATTLLYKAKRQYLLTCKVSRYCFLDLHPANTRRWTNVGLMLAHRLRRWANIKPTLIQRLVFAGRALQHLQQQ